MCNLSRIWALMRIEQFFHKGDLTPKLDFADVLLVPSLQFGDEAEVKSRADVDLQVEYTFRNTSATYTGVPVIAANMDNIGTFQVHGVFQQNKMCVALTKTTSLDSWKMNFGHGLTVDDNTAMVSIGMSDDELDLLAAVVKYTPVKFICMDIANGYLPQFARQVAKVRKLYPDKIIVAGNVVTPDAVIELYRAGADCIKVGIGGGSACSTRLVAGTGVPQLSAILECHSAARQYGMHIVSDGGCTNPGDFAKALLPASFVMAGGFFAGYNETGTKFYGMSSTEAMIKHHGGVAPHRTSEGHTFEFETTKGPLQERINYVLGGLRSACTYQNVNNLDDFRRKARFVRVNHQNNTMFFK